MFVTGGKWYCISLSFETVFYDFTLEAGDFFQFAESPNDQLCTYNETSNNQPDVEVVSVAMEMIAGEMRKTITFNYYSEHGFQMKWIEGIGSTLGFDPTGEIIDIVTTTLVCFTKNGTTYFFNGATSCDNTTLNVPDNLKSKIILAPNPVKNTSILQIPSETGIDQLRIHDISGRLVSEEIVTKNYHTINAMDYASGMYFYQVLRENSIIKTERFIVK